MDIDTQLQQLDGFTGLIASAIESGDWDGLNGILVNRQGLLDSLCASELTSQEREVVVKMMVSIQATDQQFLAQVQNQKDVLQKQAASLAHDRKAVKAYQVE
ncbi:MAG: flagellar protein FliT [Methylobacter sp.]|nr:flagellar protein FliT [Methylobacter sp.]MDP3390887.1 flagellar protein FliT [Methylococcaceae bacterium]MDP2097056.1 flagellar protein FliT [Methylobacter sp.]MDP2427994.1 flagellar protein FliT [Methylobacter sp.]MDP3055890.1 flagellar protein FliT [Methylobacter sp.]